MLTGSWDLVIGVISKVTTVIRTSNPVRALITRLSPMILQVSVSENHIRDPTVI